MLLYCICSPRLQKIIFPLWVVDFNRSKYSWELAVYYCPTCRTAQWLLLRQETYRGCWKLWFNCFGIQQYISNPYFITNSYEFSLLEIEPFFSSSPHSSVPHDSCSYCRFYQKAWFVMFVCYCLLKSVKTTFSYQQETFKIFKSMPLSLLAAIKQKWQVAVWKKQDMFIL